MYTSQYSLDLVLAEFLDYSLVVNLTPLPPALVARRAQRRPGLPLAQHVMVAVLRQAANKTMLWVSHDQSYRGLVNRVVELVDGHFTYYPRQPGTRRTST